jgi:hypothetical protein
VHNVVHLESANAMSFEDCERPVLEIKVDMFKSLYTWMKTYNSPRFSSFTKFLDV